MTTRLGRIEAIDDPKFSISELTADEAERLKTGRGSPEWFELLSTALFAGGCVGVLVYFCLMGLFVLGFWFWGVGIADRAPFAEYPLAASVVIGVCATGFVLRGVADTGYRQERANKLKQDIAAALAHTIELDLNRAIEIEEYEDEGAGFFLEITDGRVLCLISQDFYEYASDFDPEEGEEDRRNEFPQTRIRYRYAPHSGTLLDLTGIGEPLRPFGKVKTTGRFFKKDKETGRRSYTGPEDGMVYEGPLEATLAHFNYKLKPL